MRIPDPGMACWFDGERLATGEARVALTDPAVQAGLGVFETMAVRDGRALDLEAHLDRLERGAARVGLDRPPLERLRGELRGVAATLDAPAGWVKVILTGGGRTIVLGDRMDPAEEGASVVAVLLPWRRNPADPLSGLKTLSNAPNVLGLAAARQRGADEGLWLNGRGHLAEGCTSNLFIVQGGRLFTPGVREGILPGIVRGLALEAASNLGLAAHQGRVRLGRLTAAREVFLTSSLRGVRPVVAFEGRGVGSGRPGAITRRIADEVARLRAVGAPS